MNDEQRNKMKEIETLLQNQINDSEIVNAKLQSQLDDSNNLIIEQQNKMKDLEEEIKSLQNQFNDSKNLNNEQQNKMKEIETLLQKQFDEQLQNQFNEQQNKMKEIETLLQKQIIYSKELENQISQLQNKFTSSEKEIVEINKISPFKGQIVASVEKGNFVNAEINLIIQHGILDTSKSKVIISTSDAKNLGSEAYEKGESITSLHMNTNFVCGIGKYYVRCIVFNSEGESNEIVSNSVTTSASSLTFDYEGERPAKIQLPQGRYKLEVWGAKGGDSTGKGRDRGEQQTVLGGLGGYSRGILSLKQNETVYIFVGEEGHPSNSSEGSITIGSFPDGGGTNTYHEYSEYPTVPGTGGGSTSIRIRSEEDLARVIVAGGGGGASGSLDFVDRGGFGGGLNGGNSYYCGSQQKDCGCGTQAGSMCGLGNGSKGDRGRFGKGAEGKGKKGGDSGGGGGGGWYGGGSGGYGSNAPGSGGGGSGWTFTESNFNKWKEGDPKTSSEYALNSNYYLDDAVSLSGDEDIPRPDGNGTEHGHAGNGFAKITPL